MDQTGTVHSPDGFSLLLKVHAEAGLVAQRPHDDGWVVVISLHHADRSVHISVFPGRIVCNHIVNVSPLKAVALQIRLVDHVHSVLVAEIIDSLNRRIVGETDGVDIVLLHQKHVLSHHFQIHRSAAFRRIVVMVYAVNQHSLAVDCKYVSLYLHSSEAQAVAYLMGNGPVLLHG